MGNPLIQVASHAKWLLDCVEQVPVLKSLLNRVIIDKVVESGAGRPLPFTLWTPRAPHTPVPPAGDPPVDYISWAGLVDRRFTVRHLPPADAAYSARLPDLNRVLNLYKRAAFTPSKSASALLCFFAQWFTDSVLRTDPTDRRMNTSNHEIDLCQIYGLDAETAALLRTREGGRLKTSPDGLFPARLTDDDAVPLPAFRDLPYLRQLDDGQTLEDKVLGTLVVSPDEALARKRRLYATGLERGNSTIIYTAISTIFIREHNRIAGELAKAFPSWDDDRLFALARNVNIVLLLGLVINEYINQLAKAPVPFQLERHFAERETWYRANRISLEFDLLYRWHSFVPDTLQMPDGELHGDDYRFNNAVLEKYGVEALIAGASRTPGGQIGIGNNPDFMAQAEWAAHSMARDQRLQPFVNYQACFHETPAKSFSDITSDAAVAAELSDMYGGRVEDVEFLVGLFSQERDPDAVLPSLMRTMVAVDAFSQILTNPLLASNIYCDAAFSAVGQKIIDTTKSFQQVVERNKAPDAGEVYASFAL